MFSGTITYKKFKNVAVLFVRLSSYDKGFKILTYSYCEIVG